MNQKSGGESWDAGAITRVCNAKQWEYEKSVILSDPWVPSRIFWLLVENGWQRAGRKWSKSGALVASSSSRGSPPTLGLEATSLPMSYCTYSWVTTAAHQEATVEFCPTICTVLLSKVLPSLHKNASIGLSFDSLCLTSHFSRPI